MITQADFVQSLRVEYTTDIRSAHRSGRRAAGVVTMMLSNPGFYSVVAELGGRVVGSNFLDERNPIAGIGPITVDPAVQNHTVGRQLMLAVTERAAQRKFAGVRLVQAAYHNRSLCLYTKLGFETREPLSKMDGAPIAKRIPGYEVGPATESDLSACNSLCLRVHGHDRGGELHDAIKQGTAKVVEHLGRITGYATDLAFFAHAAGETNQAMIALIASAFDISSKGGILVPTRNGELFRRQVCSRRFVIETDRHQRHLMHQAQTIVQATSSTSKFKYSLQVSAARP